MALTGNWLLAQYLVVTILYKLLRLVFITVQRIYWQLNGTAQKLREARLPHNYERSAQVLDVVLSFNKYFLREKWPWMTSCVPTIASRTRSTS